MCSFLIAKFPDQFHSLYLSTSSGSAQSLKDDKLQYALMKEISQQDVIFFEKLESFFWKNDRICIGFFDNWVYELLAVIDNPISLLEKINKNKALMPANLQISIYTQVAAQMFLKGLLQKEYEVLNEVYLDLTHKVEPIFPVKNIYPSFSSKRRVYIFVPQIIWDSKSKHAPTLILKQWIELLFPVFGRVHVIVSTPINYYLPLQKRFCLNNINPSTQFMEFDVTNIEPTISNSEIRNTLLGEIGEQDICLSIGTSNILFDRIHVKNKFLWPTVQYPFLHSARFVFTVTSSGADQLAKKNIFNQDVKFFNGMSQIFNRLDPDLRMFIPSKRFEKIHDIESVHLVTIGNNIAFEKDFFEIISITAKVFKTKLTCIGVNNFDFPDMENVTFECVRFQDDLQAFVSDSNFDFFINPKRNGGGFGALVSLYAGIPVLTLPYGDIFSMMKNYYFMNKNEDFCEFIKRFKNEKEFRSLIDSLHLMMQDSFDSNKANPLSVMLDVIENQ